MTEHEKVVGVIRGVVEEMKKIYRENPDFYDPENRADVTYDELRDWFRRLDSLTKPER